MHEASYFKIGLFLVLAFVLALVGAVAIGSGALGRKPVLVETAFDESVQGLEVGSPVKYRGVRVGSVQAIELASDVYAQELEGPEAARLGTYVVVTMSITSPSIIGERGETLRENVATATRLGLRMRLTNLGLTGARYVEADYVDPERAPPPLPIGWIPRQIYVPSAPGAITRLLDSFEKLAVDLRQADVAGLIANANRFLVAAREGAERFEPGPLLEDARGLLAELRALFGSQGLRDVPAEVARTTSALAEASASLERTLARVEGALSGESAGPVLDALGASSRELARASALLAPALEDLRSLLLRLERSLASGEVEVPAILANLRTMTADLRALAESVRRWPGVLFAEPPEPALRDGARPEPALRADERRPR